MSDPEFYLFIAHVRLFYGFLLRAAPSDIDIGGKGDLDMGKVKSTTPPMLKWSSASL